jgi:nitrite reductase/ring-hydroxylating ferredoxin subunit
MLKLQIETIKAFNSIKKINLLNKGSLKNNFKLKSVAMPTILLSSYFFLHAKKQFSSKLNMAVEAQKSRRLSIDECKDLLDGEMRQVKYGNKDDDSILVVKYEGKLRALSNHCPHFGAPLHTGMLIDNVVKCPWHGASFDILTGTTDISPALDNLPIYEVLKDDLGFYINLPENVQKQVKPKMCKRDPSDKRRFIIIGGGPAALSAAETLRQSGFTGEITILSKESYIPYDRTMLSKFIPGAVEKLYLRSTDFLKEFDIDIYNNVIVSDVDNHKKIVKLQDGQEHSYDKLLIAAGGSPIVPNVQGKNNSNVHILRTFDDIQRIKNSCVDAKNIVIIGASFIGMESASSLKKAFPNATVTVVDKSITPFFATLGKEVGKALQK